MVGNTGSEINTEFEKNSLPEVKSFSSISTHINIDFQ